MARNVMMAAVVAAGLALTACGASDAAEAPVVDWVDPAQAVELDGGWTVAACEGDAPLLCVARDGAPVGVVEAAAYPLASFPLLDPGAGDAANLRAIAADFVEAMRADRAAGCGTDYGFEPIEPEPFELGDAAGLAYGFTGTRADGAPSELNLQYTAIESGRIVSIVAIAYDEGGCPGRDDLSSFDSATLAAFRPHLEAILHATPLPAVG